MTTWWWWWAGAAAEKTTSQRHAISLGKPCSRYINGATGLFKAIQCESHNTTSPQPCCWCPVMMFANDRDRRRGGLRVTVKLHNYIANLLPLFAYYFRFMPAQHLLVAAAGASFMLLCHPATNTNEIAYSAIYSRSLSRSLFSSPWFLPSFAPPPPLLLRLGITHCIRSTQLLL